MVPCAKVGGTAVVGPGTEGRPLRPSGGGRWGPLVDQKLTEGVILPLAKLSFLGPVTWALWLYLRGTVPFADFGLVFPPQEASGALPLSLPTAWSQDRPRHGRDHSSLSTLKDG